MEEKRGVLMKSSPSIFKGWQERIVLLKDRKLKYFKGNSSIPSGVLNFDHFLCEIEQSKKDPCVFSMRIVGIERLFEFKAPDQKTCQDW
jgi:hypothetical protein